MNEGRSMTLTAREAKGVIIFDIKGDLILTTVEEIALHRSVKEMLGKGKRKFLFNCAGVPFMDSTGVGELLACYVSVQNARGKLKLENVNPRIILIFKVTGIITLFTDAIFEDEKAAVKSFS
jgi:anti-sigma B factor antagonist